MKLNPLIIPNPSARDAARLSKHIVSTRTLNEILVLDTVSTDDLIRMIGLELKRPAPRSIVVRKLLGRVHARQRHQLLDLLRR